MSKIANDIAAKNRADRKAEIVKVIRLHSPVEQSTA